jgi:restriction endonuclease Mrr
VTDTDATLLDDLSGFEFEDLMEDVFRNLGYENVRQAARTADEGRDILMEETVDGLRQGVVVECKHTDSVGRPIVQKLHSAVATHEFDGPKRGIVVTTGRFTGPAEEYVQQLRETDDPYQIDLLDGDDLRDLADDIGLDLYNGRIEILCDRTLRPTDPTRVADALIRDAFRDIQNIEGSALPDAELWVNFVPTLRIRAEVDATFETSVGVVHRVNEREQILVQADRGGPAVADPAVRTLVTSDFEQAVELDEDAFAELFDELSVGRFGETETEYKEWVVERLRDRHTTTVQYTGDNNVTYTRTCEPNLSDIWIRSITPVYLPRIRSSVELGEYAYPYEYYAAGPSRETIHDDVHRCIQCGETEDTPFTYCENCGSINCPTHTKTERLVGDPVCTGCAVTDRFFLREKYFYDEDNLEAFREEYEAMPPHEKAMENKPLVAGAVLAALLVAVYVVTLV